MARRMEDGRDGREYKSITQINIIVRCVCCVCQRIGHSPSTGSHIVVFACAVHEYGNIRAPLYIRLYYIQFSIGMRHAHALRRLEQKFHFVFVWLCYWRETLVENQENQALCRHTRKCLCVCVYEKRIGAYNYVITINLYLAKCACVQMARQAAQCKHNIAVPFCMATTNNGIFTWNTHNSPWYTNTVYKPFIW